MTNNFYINKLSTERLMLRPFIQADFNFLKEHFTKEGVTKFLYDMEPPTTDERVQEVLEWCMDSESGDHMRWGIALKENPDNLIGTCGFHCYDEANNAAEVGYDLSDEHWRNGYMSEALKEILIFGFEELNLHKVSAYVYPENTASSSLLEKLGFKLDGVVRDKHLFRGKYYDHNLYSLFENEITWT